MKILLVNPPHTHMINSEVPRAVRDEGAALPPLGLLYLQASLVSAGHSATIADLALHDYDDAALRLELARGDYEIIGITAVTHTLVDVRRVARTAKALNPHCHVCIGGPHTGIFPWETLQFPEVDSIIIGEGEAAIVALAQALDQKIALPVISGVYYRAVVSAGTGFQAAIPASDLDSLPLPNRKALGFDPYFDVMAVGGRLATLITSRGCPFRCSFCSTPKEDCRSRSPANVVAEIEECLAAGVSFMYILDDTFNLDEKRVAELCRLMTERRLRVRWSCRARVDRLTMPSLQAMKRAGCVRIQLGVETGSEEGLRALNKGITLAQIRAAFRMTRAAGIASVAYFMIGLPHEKTPADVEMTLRFAIELDPDYAMFNVFTPYPGTELYDAAVSRGVIASDCWREFALDPRPDFRPEVWSEFLDREVLFALLDRIYRRFYWRPKMIVRSLKAIDSFGDLKRRAAAGAKMLLTGKK